MHHAFLYISLPSLHDYNVKVPNFTFCRGHENKTTINFSLLPNLNTVFYTRKICQHLTNWTSWNKRDKIWSSAKSLFKWRFRSRRLRCYWSSLMIKKYLLCVFTWRHRNHICVPNLSCGSWTLLLCRTISFVPINLHGCWPREWKHRIYGANNSLAREWRQSNYFAIFFWVLSFFSF